MAISFELNCLCDAKNCSAIEISETQDDPYTGVFSDYLQEQGWFWGGDNGYHYCSEHRHLVSPVLGGAMK